MAEIASGATPASSLFRDWRLLVTIFAFALAPQITSTASPFLNGAVMATRQIGEDQIGLIRTCEILTGASVMIWLSANITRFPLRSIGFLGVGLILAGNLAAMLAPNLIELGVCRVIAGAGQGCLLGALGGFIAQSKNPHRIATVISIAVAAAAILASILLGYAAKFFGERGVFSVIAGSALIALGLMSFAPKGRPHATHQAQVRSMLGALRSPYVLSYATIFVGSTAVWHFFAKIGASHGLDQPQIGQLNAVVAAGCAVLLPLAALAKEHHVRFGVIAALIGFGLGSATIPLATNQTLFIGGFVFQTIGYAFWTVFGAAVAARLDRTGGLAAAGQGWNALGNALSPALGGYLIAYGGGYPTLGGLCLLASGVTVALMWIATRNLPPSHASEKT
jgi:MFS family permease